VALGIDAVEFDLRVSRDGALVVIHDETLDRTTDGSGPVALRSVTELEGLDAGARFTADGGRSFPWRGRGVRLSTFDEIIESLPRELPCIVELKTALRPSLCGSPFAVTQLRTGSSSLDSIPARRARSAAPDSRSVRARPMSPVSCVPRSCDDASVPSSFRRSAFRRAGTAFRYPAALALALRGTVIHVWTVNDPAYALRLWRAGVQGILSDDPRSILAVRDSLSR
jgi:glycerophosphoryl diester phosphodiesterase